MKKNISFLFFSFFIFIVNFLLSEEPKKLKILHLTFHKGCQKELEGVAKCLNFEIETWFIPNLPALWFDGKTKTGLYNIGHERAERIWNLHKDKFEKYDAIITSDTAPLARIFLQNNFQKPLIFWICNRFDYPG